MLWLTVSVLVAFAVAHQPNVEMGRIGNPSLIRRSNEPNSYDSSWGYDRKDLNPSQVGPDEWKNIGWATCDSSTVEQSPINVVTSTAVYEESFQKLSWTFPNGETFPNINLVNYGWTYNADLPSNSIFVSGGPFPAGEKYEVVNIHLHRISEHTINGAHHPVEMHMVTQNVDVCPWYWNETAVALGGQGPCLDTFKYYKNTPRALAIFSFLFKEGENYNADANSFLQPIVEAIDVNPDAMKVEYASTPISTLDFSFLSTSEMNNYYTYRGGITIPPCVATVTWTVFETVITASGAQLQSFIGDFPVENFRPTQPIASRVVQTNIKPAAQNPDNTKNSNNNNNNNITDGDAVAIAVCSAVFGMAVVGAIVFIRQRRYRSIHSDNGSTGKRSNEVNINDSEDAKYQSA